MNAGLQTQLKTATKGSFTPVRTGLLQRKCACGGTPGPTGECEECRKKRLSLQRKALDSDTGTQHQPTIPSIVHEVLRSPGQPLDAATRAFMEPRFGHDFSHVRVHTDTKSAESARAVNALAYTIGLDVVFDHGRFAPENREGKRLLAHELTHVVQQNSGIRMTQGWTGNEDRYERQAEQTAGAIVNEARRPNSREHYSPLSFPRSNMRNDPHVLPLQRTVRDTSVSCHTTGLNGGVAGGHISGPRAIAIITVADAQAKAMASDAKTRLNSKLTTFGTSGYVLDPLLDTALASRFGLSLATSTGRHQAGILERELNAVVGLLNRVIYYVCRDSNCDRGDWAWSEPGKHTIHLCVPFWQPGATLHQQGSTILHEAVHLWWNQVEDWGHKPLHNAHCFEQFALDLAGATADILPEFANACVP